MRVQDMVRLEYHDGMSCAEIMEKYAIKRATLYEYLHIDGIIVTIYKGEIVAYKIDDVKKDYSAGMPEKEISEKYKIYPAQIHKVCNGLVPRYHLGNFDIEMPKPPEQKKIDLSKFEKLEYKGKRYIDVTPLFSDTSQYYDYWMDGDLCNRDKYI